MSTGNPPQNNVQNTYANGNNPFFPWYPNQGYPNFNYYNPINSGYHNIFDNFWLPNYLLNNATSYPNNQPNPPAFPAAFPAGGYPRVPLSFPYFAGQHEITKVLEDAISKKVSDDVKKIYDPEEDKYKTLKDEIKDLNDDFAGKQPPELPKIILNTKPFTLPKLAEESVKWTKNAGDTNDVLSHYLNLFGQYLGAGKVVEVKNEKDEVTGIDFDFNLKKDQTIHDVLSSDKLKSGLDDMIRRLESDLENNNAVKNDGFSKSFVSGFLDKLRLLKDDVEDMTSKPDTITDTLSESMYAFAEARNDFALKMVEAETSIFNKLMEFFKNLFSSDKTISPEKRVQQMNNILDEMETVRRAIEATKVGDVDRIALHNMTFSINLQLARLKKQGGFKIYGIDEAFAEKQIKIIKEKLAEIHNLANTPQGLTPELPNVVEKFKYTIFNLQKTFSGKSKQNERVFIVKSYAAKSNMAEKINKHIDDFKYTAYFNVPNFERKTLDFVSKTVEYISDLKSIQEKTQYKLDTLASKTEKEEEEMKKDLNNLKTGVEEKISKAESLLKDVRDKILLNKLNYLREQIYLASKTKIGIYKDILTDLTKDEVDTIKESIKEIGKNGKSIGSVLDKIPEAQKILKFIESNNLYSDDMDHRFAIELAVFKATKESQAVDFYEINFLENSLLNAVDTVLNAGNDTLLNYEKAKEHYEMEKSNAELCRFAKKMINQTDSLKQYRGVVNKDLKPDIFLDKLLEITPNNKEISELQALIGMYRKIGTKKHDKTKSTIPINKLKSEAVNLGQS